MRSVILLFLFIMPFILKGQFEDLKLNNGEIYYERVFSLDNLEIEGIQKLLEQKIAKIEAISDFKLSNSIITAKIENKIINCNSLLPPKSNPAIVMIYPMYADVVVEWKKGRYRVTVKNIKFHTNVAGIVNLSSAMTKKGNKEIRSAKPTIDAGICIEKYLTNLFSIKPEIEYW